MYTFSLKISQKPSFTLRLSTLFIKQMYILRVVIFSLGEQNLTRILTVFKENLVKYKEKRTSREYIYFVPDTKTKTKTYEVRYSCFSGVQL